MPVIVPHDDNPKTVQPLLKKYVIRKSLQIAATYPRQINMMTLRIFCDRLDCAVYLIPKLPDHPFRRPGIPQRDLANVSRRLRMNDQLHQAARLPPTSLPKLLEAQSLHLSRIQFLTPPLHLLVLNPVVSPFQTLDEMRRQLRPVPFRELGCRVSNLTSLNHATNLPPHRRPRYLGIVKTHPPVAAVSNRPAEPPRSATPSPSLPPTSPSAKTPPS